MPGRRLCVAACAAWLVSCGAQPNAPGSTLPPSPGAPVPPAPPAKLSSACDGLLPTPGPYLSATRPGTNYDVCPGTTDGSGDYVALGTGTPRWWTFDMIPMAGGEPAGSMFVQYPGGTDFAPMESGFQMTEGVSTAAFVAVDALGNERARASSSTIAIQVNPRGGSVVFFHAHADTSGVDTPYEVQWRTTDGVVTASATVAGLAGVLGVDRSGHALVVVSDGEGSAAGAASLRWVGPAGPVSAPFPSPGVGRPQWDEARLLADGSLAIWGHDRRGETVIGVVREGETQLSPAPAWLRGLEPWSFVLVRGGTAHAVFPAIVHELGSVPIEIVAADGELCGTVVLSSDAAATAAVSIGRDGTAILGMARLDDPGGPYTCEWRWWPGLFR